MYDIDARAKAISDWVPDHIRAKVAYKGMLDTERWMLANPYESDVPFDKSEFWFEGKRYTPGIDFRI